MSEDAWKSSATTTILRSVALHGVNLKRASLRRNGSRRRSCTAHVGEGDRDAIGEVNGPDSAQALNVPSNRQNLIRHY